MEFHAVERLIPHSETIRFIFPAECPATARGCYRCARESSCDDENDPKPGTRPPSAAGTPREPNIIASGHLSVHAHPETDVAGKPADARRSRCGVAAAGRRSLPDQRKSHAPHPQARPL